MLLHRGPVVEGQGDVIWLVGSWTQYVSMYPKVISPKARVQLKDRIWFLEKTDALGCPLLVELQSAVLVWAEVTLGT